MTTNEVKELGRARNAAMTYLERKLYVPKIYIDAEWNGVAVDVLAIDRDGAGDVAVVLMFARPYEENGHLDLLSQQVRLERLIKKFLDIPANYKYIGVVETMKQTEVRAVFRMPDSLAENLFSHDFIGKIGVLHIDAPDDGEPQTQLISRPERFRAKIAQLANNYLQEHMADWEIRA